MFLHGSNRGTFVSSDTIPSSFPNYRPFYTLNELYKLYVRPHIDYGDVIYHIPAKMSDFSQNIVLPNLMEKLESVQYSAALAVTEHGEEHLVRSCTLGLVGSH